MHQFGKGDLYLFYIDLYKEKEEWRRKFRSLETLLESYIDYLKMSEDERSRLDSHPLGALQFFNIKECLEHTEIVAILECLLQKGSRGEGIFL